MPAHRLHIVMDYLLEMDNDSSRLIMHVVVSMRLASTALMISTKLCCWADIKLSVIHGATNDDIGKHPYAD